MLKRSAKFSICLLMLALCGVGCLRDATLDINRAPLANAGEDQKLDWNGDPVAVTLDGSKSRDLDGKVVGYDWRLVKPSAAADAGTAVAGDAGDSAADPVIDPANVRKPTIELDKGTYTFMLWVRDDHGAISEPDTVTIRIGADPVEECLAGTYEMLDDGCRACLCNQDEACQTAVPACGADCWGLIACIAVNCPTFTTDMDISCVAAHCAQFVAGGQAGAMAAGSCVSPCSTACTPSINAIAGNGN